jgi:mannan endo-1,4-beta-mannosidase
MWAPSWSWFDPKIAAAYGGAAKMKEYLDWHRRSQQDACRRAEFGISDTVHSADRHHHIPRQFYTAIWLLAPSTAGDDAKPAQLGVGWLGRTQNADFMWKAGDSFVGDPPQEPQGLYCVFDSDVSTVNIISAHARQMTGLH